MRNEKPLFSLANANEMTVQQLSERLFSNKFRVVGNLTEWVRGNPRRYAEARAIAQADGRVGEDREQRAQRRRDEAVMHPAPKPLTPEVQAARIEFDEEKCRQMFHGDGAAKLKAVDPEAYQRLKKSAASFGVIGEGSSFFVSESARRTVTRQDALDKAVLRATAA